MKKYIPPIDFFKYNPEKREINLGEVKAKLIDSKEHGIAFLTLFLSNPSTATELTRDLGRIFERSYRQKTYRILCDLVNFGIVRYIRYSSIDIDNPNEVEREIIKKHKGFLSRTNNPWGNDYENMVYYIISPRGMEILDFVALKYKFNITEE